MNISDVPNNGKLYFWDGQLWLRWDDPDDLPGPEGDPLRIKIVTPENTGGRISYFISPQAQNLVRAAVFYIIDQDRNGVGVGVFFSKSKAVTADHNLTASQVVGTKVVMQIPELHEELTMTVSARDTEMDYAILQSSTDHAYLPVYDDPPEQLVGADLVLAGYCIGIEEYAPMFSRRLGFTKADTITLSNHNNHLFFRCTTFAGDSGAALILMDGCLVGIHQEAVNALRERLQHAKLVKDMLSEVELSIDAVVNRGVAQGCCALLSSVFAK
ncbi:hypothetical protein WJX82_003467 [Trebouxia sp. C0006]